MCGFAMALLGGTNVRSLLFNDVFIHQTRNIEKQCVRTLRSDARLGVHCRRSRNGKH